MSADNGIYIGEFPDGTFRVGHGFESVVQELETHFMTPKGYAACVEGIWGNSDAYTDQEEAFAQAQLLLQAEEYTEYGICNVQLPVNYGEEKPETPVPELMEGACKHCSTPGGRQVLHGGNLDSCEDPALPRNILIKGLREVTNGVQVEYIARMALDILRKNDLLKEG